MTLKFIMILVIFFSAMSDLHAKKLALVIGNADYKYDEIGSSVNDANDFGEALRNCGFNVVLKKNITKNEFIDTLSVFKKSISSSDVVLFYYVGHGIQIEGMNKFLTIESEAADKVNIDDFSVDLKDVIDTILKAKMRIIILDASKKNPFHDYYIYGKNRVLTKDFIDSSFGRPERGLADKDAPIKTFIAYSTAAGSFSYDKDGRNGVYTKHILNNILKPGFKLEDVFKLVRDGVYKETNGSQLPWENSSILEKFYFVDPETVNVYIKDKNTFVPAF